MHNRPGVVCSNPLCQGAQSGRAKIFLDVPTWQRPVCKFCQLPFEVPPGYEVPLPPGSKGFWWPEKGKGGKAWWGNAVGGPGDGKGKGAPYGAGGGNPPKGKAKGKDQNGGGKS